MIVFSCAASAAVIVLHRANLRRLRAGTENRFRLRRRTAARGAATLAAEPVGERRVPRRRLAARELAAQLADGSVALGELRGELASGDPAALHTTLADWLRGKTKWRRRSVTGRHTLSTHFSALG